MAKIIDILRTEYSSEYSLKKYTKPKIYPKAVTKKPLSEFSEKEKETIMLKYKRWYVYFDYLIPDSNPPKFKRQPPIYYNVNRDYPNFDDRLKHIKIMRNSVEKILKDGYSPIKDTSENALKIAKSAFDYALAIKKTEVKPTTYADYEQRIKQFKVFLSKQDIKYKAIENIDKKIVSKFLDSFDGAKNRNNVKAALSSVFTVLSDKSLIKENFIKELRNKKIVEKPVTIYTEKEIENISKILKEQDYTLQMFIYFVSYMFWRPVEILRIQVQDIDFKKKIIRTETKTKASKTKIIPDLLIDELKEFAKNKKGFLFKPDNFENWDLEDNEKRKYFTRRFSRFREKNNISSEFKIYSFRHTYITKIYLMLRKSNSKEETIKILSLITGHESKAIYKYIQVNDVELPEDYSEYLK